MKAVWIALVASACGSKSEPPPKPKTLDDLRPAWADKVRARLDKVIAAAKSAPGAELGEPSVEATASTLKLDFDWDDEKAHPNAFVVPAEDVLSATEIRPAAPKKSADDVWKAAAEGKPIPVPGKEHPRFTFQDDGRNHVLKAKALLGVPGTEGGLYPEWVYQQFVDAKYMLVVSWSDIVWPVELGSSYEPGHVALRAVLVDIETAKPLGGFETVAASSKEFTFKEKLRGPSTDHQPTFDKDLKGQAGDAIAKGIQKRWPGAKTPVSNWGFAW